MYKENRFIAFSLDGYNAEQVDSHLDDPNKKPRGYDVPRYQDYLELENPAEEEVNPQVEGNDEAVQTTIENSAIGQTEELIRSIPSNRDLPLGTQVARGAEQPEA